MKNLSISESEIIKVIKEDPESRAFFLELLEKRQKFEDSLTLEKFKAEEKLKNRQFKNRSRELDLKEKELDNKSAIVKQQQKDDATLDKLTASFGAIYILTATSIGGYLIYNGHGYFGAIVAVAGNLSGLTTILEKFKVLSQKTKDSK